MRGDGVVLTKIEAKACPWCGAQPTIGTAETLCEDSVMSKAAPDRFLALPVAATRLRLAYRAVYELATAGRLGDVERRGSRIFVEARAVDRLVAEHTQAASGGDAS